MPRSVPHTPRSPNMKKHSSYRHRLATHTEHAPIIAREPPSLVTLVNGTKSTFQPARRILIGSTFPMTGGNTRIQEHYGCFLITADVTKIIVPKDGVRAKNRVPSHGDFKTMFMNPNTYGDNKSWISACVLGMEIDTLRELYALVHRKGSKEVNIHSLSNENGSLQKTLSEKQIIYVDGVRRGAALCHRDVLQRSSSSRNVLVWMYFRKDGIPMEGHYAILIGTVLNIYSSSVIKLTNSDAVYLVNSYLRQLKGAIFPNGYPTAIESNTSLKTRVVRLRTFSKSLKVRDVSYIVTQMGLLPHIKDTQARTISTVALGVFRYHDSNHSEKRLFSFISEIPLRVLKLEFIWNCSSFYEQMFVLQGIVVMLFKKKKGNASVSAEHRPQVMVDIHYKRAVTIIRTLWGTLREFFARPNNISDELLFESTPSGARDILPWRTSELEGTTYVDELFMLMQQYSTTEFLKLCNEPHIMRRKCENIIDLLTLRTKLQTKTRSDKSNAVENEKKIRERSRRKVRRRVVTESTDDDSDCMSILQGSIAPVSSSPTERQEAHKTRFEPPSKRTKCSSAQNRVLAGKSKACTHAPKSNAKEKECQTIVNWKKSKEKLHAIEVQARETWNQSEVEEGNIEDEYGFCVTHRTNGFVAWVPPRVRAEGFESLERETESDFRGLGYVPDEHEFWWKGKVRLIGSKTSWLLRVFEDTDRGFSKLCPDFKLEGTMAVPQPEIVIPWQPPHPLQNLSERFWPEDPRIHVILRTLGFRPPHRSFLTGFSLNAYREIRNSLMASILHHEHDWFSELRSANTGEDGSLSPFASNMVTSEALTNFFRASRERLDSSGFVIFPRLFGSLSFISKSAVWPSMEHIMETDCLYSTASAFITHWIDAAPTAEQIRSAQLSTDHFLSWSGIRNTTVDEALQIQSSSRLMHTKYAATTYYEESSGVESRLPILKSKCYMEVAIMQLCAWLRLVEEDWNETRGDPDALFQCYKHHTLSAPDTGGRLIITGTRDTPSQVTHLDYSFSVDESLAPDGSSLRPPFFALISFGEYVPLYVLEGSQRLLQRTSHDLSEIGSRLPLKQIVIPPWSLILLRGDLLHAGAGGADTAGKHAARFHMYIMRKGVALGDTINDTVGRKFSVEKINASTGMHRRIRKR